MKRFLQFALLTVLTVTFLSFIGKENQEIQNSDPYVKFVFTTKSHGGDFSPNHVLAVWVTDTTGVFVKSLKVMANKRIQYLYKWNNNSGKDKTDAVSGATLLEHQTHTVFWNCKDINGQFVTDNDYIMNVEFTDFHGQGPFMHYRFSKDSDSSLTNYAETVGFKNVSIKYVQAITSINNDLIGNNKIQVFPNPANKSITIQKNESSIIKAEITNLNGKVVFSEEYNHEKSFIQVNIENKEVFTSGLYLIKVFTNKGCQVSSFMISE